jgi:hypothetical protein
MHGFFFKNVFKKKEKEDFKIFINIKNLSYYFAKGKGECMAL